MEEAKVKKYLFDSSAIFDLIRSGENALGCHGSFHNNLGLL